MQCFLVDMMLMRLGRWLWLLGQDVASRWVREMTKLLLQAKELVQDYHYQGQEIFPSLCGRSASCLLISSSAIFDQLQEMADAVVPLRLDPQMYTLCDGFLVEMEILGMKKWQCRACKKLYWEGGHWQKMKRMLQAICCRR